MMLLIFFAIIYSIKSVISEISMLSSLNRSCQKPLFLSYGNKDADQHEHLLSVIIVFVVCSLESIMDNSLQAFFSSFY